MTNPLSNKVKIKRLEWQIKEMDVTRIDCANAIQRRKDAISYLRKNINKTMGWAELCRKFGFEYYNREFYNLKYSSDVVTKI